MQSNGTRIQGSSKSGARHWWAQRLSALIMIPLSIWFVVSLIRMPFWNYDGLLIWVSRTFNAAGLLIMIVATLYHAALGMQVVYEDYVKSEGLKLACVLVTNLIAIFLGVIAILSISKIYFILG